MSRIEDIDSGKPIELRPYQSSLQGVTFELIERPPVVIKGEEVALFLAWAKCWRAEIEKDLQCMVNDAQGLPLLSAFMPLVTFRLYFCSGGRQLQDQASAALMERILSETSHWRDAGTDLVDITGYKKLHPPRFEVEITPEHWLKAYQEVEKESEVITRLLPVDVDCQKLVETTNRVTDLPSCRSRSEYVAYWLAEHFGSTLGWAFVDTSPALGEVFWEEFFDGRAFLPVFVAEAKKTGMPFDDIVEGSAVETLFGKSCLFRQDISTLPEQLAVELIWLTMAAAKTCSNADIANGATRKAPGAALKINLEVLYAHCLGLMQAEVEVTA